MDDMLKRKLGLLSACDYLTENQRDKASLALDHISYWGVGTPTTCGYQIVFDDQSKVAVNAEIGSDHNVEIVQYFCCKGLGICYRIRTYWVHMFLAYCFSHYTSVAIFIKDEKVYFGKYPGVTIFAWGKGRPNSSFTAVVNGVQVRRSRRNA